MADKIKKVDAWIAELSRGQGFWGRLQRNLKNAPEGARASFYKHYGNCKDIVDFVIAVEG